MSVVQVLNHRGMEIIFGDFHNMTDPQAIVNGLDEVQETIKQKSRKYLLLLYDVSGTRFNSDVAIKVKELGRTVKSYQVRAYSAVMGAHVLAKAALIIIRPGMYFGDTKEECLNWLVRQLEPHHLREAPPL
jgi:23S rRNA A2030 N6-methylase RlmJ